MARAQPLTHRVMAAMLKLLALSLLHGSACGSGAQPGPAWGPSPTVGRWSGPAAPVGTMALPSLPQSSAGNLPHSPMLGNGYIGAMLSTNRLTPPLISTGCNRGPAAPGDASLNVWLGSNSMWGVYPSAKTALGPTTKATRRAVGGLTMSGLAELFPGADPSIAVEQRILRGILTTAHTATDGGTLSTTTYVSPTRNVLITNVTWVPPATTSMVAPVEIGLSLFTFRTYANCCPPGQHSPAVVPTSTSVLGEVLAITRDAVPSNITSARRIKAAVAVAVAGVSGGVTVGGYQAINASADDPVAEARATITVSPGAGFEFSLVVSFEDNLQSPSASSAALAATAAAAAKAAAPGPIAVEADAWWAKFWRTSRVWLPTEPAIEALWNGAQYILACSASADVDPDTPAPGLGGPFVTSDNSGWNGDYTLDYNYEATFYGVYASGHPELAQTYWQPMLDGMAAAERGAQDRARAHNLTCPPTALHFNAHIGPWGTGDFDEEWETQSGQHMMWNGVFGALLFLNDYEYMGSNRSSFFKKSALPLLEGLLDWWACYLTKTPCSAGTPDCPAGGYRYDDANDAVNEGTKTVNSQIALAFVARLADVLRRLPPGLSRSTAIAEDIATHLARFDTATCISPIDHARNETVWVTSQGAPIQHSSMFAAYPIFPSEFLSAATATTAELTTAQASARVYDDLAGGRPVETFATTVLAGNGLSDIAWAAQDVVDGLKAHMDMHFGPNLLCDTNGGGIENVGMSRAVSEMLVSAPSGQYISLFPFWPKTAPASFGGLMVKGGFRLWANYTAAEGVQSPVRMRSIAGAEAVILNPWPGHEVNVSIVSDETRHAEAVSITGWSNVRAGPTFSFLTTASDDHEYVVSKVEGKLEAEEQAVVTPPEVSCTSFTSNCSECIGANDTRARWASPCVYLSGPSEDGARCQPSKWWFPPYNAAKLYPHAHACSSCTTPASACKALPVPKPAPPPPPPPPTLCPIKQLCGVEMNAVCGAARAKGETECVACMKANSATLTADGCTTDSIVSYCSERR